MLDVSESVLRIHTMIAGKDIAIMLDYDGTAALLRMDTDRGRVPDPGVEGPLKVHHKDISHIMTHPLIVDRYQEVAILFGDNRPWRYFSLLFSFFNEAGPARRRPDCLLNESATRSTTGENWMNSTP